MLDKNHLAKIVKAVQKGQPWYGPSIEKALMGVTATQAYAKPIDKAHSIWELVLHIINWRKFAIEQLSGNHGFDIEINGEQDWTPIVDNSEEAWEKSLVQLEESTSKLVAVLQNLGENTDIDKLITVRQYPLKYLLDGIIHHDIYHIGQIVLLKKLV